MKKAIVLAIIGLFAFVQAAKAQFYVGGSFHISSEFTENPTTSIGLSPDLGYTLGDWCFGAALSLNVTGGNQGTVFTATPYVEYFFWSSGALSFFVEGGADLDWAGSTFSFYPYVAPGISFDISDHWSVLGHIGRLGYNTLNKQLVFTTSGASALSLGLYYSF